MAVLHILLGILKIVGIILVILFIVLLFALGCLLFCPFVYQGFGEKSSNNVRGNLRISWLFRGISLKIWYEEDIDYSIQLMGISFERLKAMFKRKKSTQREDSHELTAMQEEKMKSNVGIKQDAKKAVQREMKKAEDQSSKKKKWNLKKWFQSFHNFRLTLEKICDKIKKIRKILKSEQIKRTKVWVIREIKDLLVHIKPKKIQGNLRFGMADPCLTGEILAVISIFYPLYGEYFKIEPFFEKEILEGKLAFQGRIYGIYFVLLAWRIFQNKDLRMIIKKFKYI